MLDKYFLEEILNNVIIRITIKTFHFAWCTNIKHINIKSWQK